MGMFDEYIPAPPIVCPVCGQELTDWQGKDGPNLLLVWRQGERFPIDCQMSDDCYRAGKQDFLRDPGNRLPERFEIYTDTCRCKRFVYAVGSCRDERWDRTELLSRDNAVPYANENDRDFRKRMETLERWRSGRAT